MKRVLARVLTTLLVTPALAGAVAGSAEASHSITIPGCYGATSNGIVCNPTVTYGVPLGVETYEETVPVCVGTCVDVPVTLVRSVPGEPLVLCASFTDRNGNPTSRCVDDGDLDEAIALLGEVVDTGRHIAADAVVIARQVLCENDTVRCSSLLVNLFYTIETLLRP